MNEHASENRSQSQHPRAHFPDHSARQNVVAMRPNEQSSIWSFPETHGATPTQRFPVRRESRKTFRAVLTIVLNLARNILTHAALRRQALHLLTGLDATPRWGAARHSTGTAVSQHNVAAHGPPRQACPAIGAGGVALLS